MFANVLQLPEGGDFTTELHLKTALQIYIKLSNEAQSRHFLVGAVISWPSVHRDRKPLSLLSFTVLIFNVLVCAVAYFLFFRREGFFYSIFLGWETCKLFDIALVSALACVALAMSLKVCVGFLFTTIYLLNKWTFYTSVTTINTAVALFWF